LFKGGQYRHNRSRWKSSVIIKATGSSSHDLLSGDIYKGNRIGLCQGFEPSATAINNFISFLNARSNKPGGITVVKGRLPHQENYFYKSGNCSYRRCQQNKYNANQIAVWALLLTGIRSDSGDSYVLGTAYRNVFVIYEKTIQSLSNSLLNLVGLYLKQQL
jgi:hypothetical protein